MGAAKYYRAHNGSLGDEPLHPREASNQWLADDPDKFADMKVRGFTSGRLPISSFLGFAVQAVLVALILLTAWQSML